MIKLGKIDKILRAIALILAATFVSACATGIGPGASLTSAEKMMWSTYAVATSKGMATSVVINARDPYAPHSLTPVVVTAAHVLAAAPHGPFYVVTRTLNGGGNPGLAILELKPPGSELLYVKHPRQDIAAFALRVPVEMAGAVSLPSFINENAIARPGKDAHVGDEISVLGFPQIYPGTRGAFAILRDGKVASYSVGTPRDRERFLLNTNVYAGDSGAPVFKGRRRSTPRLVGMVTERIGKKAGAVPLAVAIDANVIRETLQILAQRQARFIQEGRTRKFAPNPATPASVKLVGPPGVFGKMMRTKSPAAQSLPSAE